MRERFIRESAPPQALKRKLRETFLHVGAKDAELTERALRQFFIATLAQPRPIHRCAHARPPM